MTSLSYHRANLKHHIGSNRELPPRKLLNAFMDEWFEDGTTLAAVSQSGSQTPLNSESFV